MTILRIKLPDLLNPDLGTEFLATQPLEYALLQEPVATSSRRANMDKARLANMPRAETVEVILPARATALVRIKVPRARASALQRALPNLVEDALIGDAHASHCVLLPGLYAGGERDVAVTDRSWMRLAREVAQGCSARRSLCVSEVLLVPEIPFIVVNSNVATVAQASGVSGFVRHAQGVLPFSSDASVFPAELRLLRPILGAGGAGVALAGANSALREAWAKELDLTLSVNDWSWYNAAAVEPSMTLFQGEFARPSRQVREWRRTWRWPLFLASASIVVAIVGLNLHWLKLAREASALRARMNADFNILLPGVSDRGEPLLMAKRQLSLQRGDDTFLILTQALAQAAPAPTPNVPPLLKSLNYRDGLLRAELHSAPDASTVAQRLRSQREVQVRTEGHVLILSRRGA
jgi:general secretion pathway protein L